MLCLQAFRNPPLAAVISHLQHAALTMPPAPRTAAVQALTKVEPPPLHQPDIPLKVVYAASSGWYVMRLC
jgi:hypothetical protein